MTKQFKFFLMIIGVSFVMFIGLGLLITATNPKFEIPGHQCRWAKCPYKEVQPDDYKEAVIEYTGEEGTDAYCIDMLHLQYPDKDYDQLEDILFNNNKPIK